MSDVAKSKKLRRAEIQKKYYLKNKKKLQDYQKNYRIRMKEKPEFQSKLEKPI